MDESRCEQILERVAHLDQLRDLRLLTSLQTGVRRPAESPRQIASTSIGSPDWLRAPLSSG
jgi:hypothetical protein